MAERSEWHLLKASQRLVRTVSVSLYLSPIGSTYGIFTYNTYHKNEVNVYMDPMGISCFFGPFWSFLSNSEVSSRPQGRNKAAMILLVASLRNPTHISDSFILGGSDHLEITLRTPSCNWWSMMKCCKQSKNMEAGGCFWLISNVSLREILAAIA